MLSALHFLGTWRHIRSRGLIPSFDCYDLSMTCSMRDSNDPKPFLSKGMVARFRNAFLPNVIFEQCWHASKFHFADLQAYGDEGRLPSILFESGTEDLLLEGTRRSLSSCMLERWTDSAHSAREDEKCKGWIGPISEFREISIKGNGSCQAANQLGFASFDSSILLYCTC